MIVCRPVRLERVSHQGFSSADSSVIRTITALVNSGDIIQIKLQYMWLQVSEPHVSHNNRYCVPRISTSHMCRIIIGIVSPEYPEYPGKPVRSASSACYFLGSFSPWRLAPALVCHNCFFAFFTSPFYTPTTKSTHLVFIPLQARPGGFSPCPLLFASPSAMPLASS